MTKDSGQRTRTTDTAAAHPYDVYSHLTIWAKKECKEDRKEKGSVVVEEGGRVKK